VVAAAAGVGAAVDALEQRCEHAPHEVVGRVVVVAEARRAVREPRAQRLLPLEVRVERRDQLRQGHRAGLEHVRADRREASVMVPMPQHWM
jgi:hypothetical protein